MRAFMLDPCGLGLPCSSSSLSLRRTRRRDDVANTGVVSIRIVAVVRVIAVNVGRRLGSTFPFACVRCVAGSSGTCYWYSLGPGYDNRYRARPR